MTNCFSRIECPKNRKHTQHTTRKKAFVNVLTRWVEYSSTSANPHKCHAIVEKKASSISIGHFFCSVSVPFSINSNNEAYIISWQNEVDFYEANELKASKRFHWNKKISRKFEKFIENRAFFIGIWSIVIWWFICNLTFWKRSDVHFMCATYVHKGIQLDAEAGVI